VNPETSSARRSSLPCEVASGHQLGAQGPSGSLVGESAQQEQCDRSESRHDPSSSSSSVMNRARCLWPPPSTARGFPVPCASRSAPIDCRQSGWPNTAVPGCWRHDSSRPPASTPSKPRSSRSAITIDLARASSPATGSAMPFLAPLDRARLGETLRSHVVEGLDDRPPEHARPPARLGRAALDRFDAPIAPRRIVVPSATMITSLGSGQHCVLRSLENEIMPAARRKWRARVRAIAR